MENMSMTRRELVTSIATVSLIGLSGCRTPVKDSFMNQTNITSCDSRTGESDLSQSGIHTMPKVGRRRILHVATNASHYVDVKHKTGLWLSELTHAYDVFSAAGYEQQIVSPQGGKVPIEPRSLKWPHFDKSARDGLANLALSALLANSVRPEDINAADFDAIYFTGGHGTMWDFPDNMTLQTITRDIYEGGGVVSSVCHGYVGLLNTQLSDGRLLVHGRRLTGYSWVEEILAGVARDVPYNAEERMREQGAIYEKNFLPFTPKVVVDGRLITGQNPQSAKAVAKAISSIL